MGVKEGTLIIDAKTKTLVEHRSGELIEKLSNYVDIDPGHPVPLRIQIKNRNQSFDWTFRVHPPGLWLFESGTLNAQGKRHPISVTDVVIQSAAETKK